jgi:hypothetical protein
MTSLSLDLVFDLVILCDTSMPRFHTYPKLQISFQMVGWKRKATSKAFGEDHAQNCVIECIIWGT